MANGARAELSEEAVANLRSARTKLLEAIADGAAHYGINTGFGSLARQRVSDEQLRDLQLNLIRSHSAGVGEPLPDPVVRGMMLVLAGSLCRGVSGIREETVHTIVALLNAGITPVVPELGSVGASGDLAPLAHVSLALVGEGRVRVAGATLDASKAMSAAGIPPIALEAKEGLALINGTHLMAAQGALLAQEVSRVWDAAIVACAMSIDACRASDRFLDDRVYVARNQPGVRAVATALRAAISGSEIIPSHADNDPRVQDPYSFRCAAPVLGAASDAICYVRSRVDDELGAVTDNPLVVDGTAGPEILSAGNFHGMPIALPLDVCAIALSHVAGIAERRLYHMLSAFDPEACLPPFLSPSPGVHSGLMIVQYAAAACCNELIGLANPASVANLSTCAGMEDYNSFGPRSAAKARRAVSLTRSVIAIELLCAAEAIEHHRPLRSGTGVERAIETVRTVVTKIEGDRPFHADVAAIESLIADGRFGPEDAG